MAAIKNGTYYIFIVNHDRGKFVIWCVNQYFQGPEIQWKYYFVKSSRWQVLMAILVVFQNRCHRKYSIIYNFACDFGHIHTNLVSKYTF